MIDMKLFYECSEKIFINLGYNPITEQQNKYLSSLPGNRFLKLISTFLHNATKRCSCTFNRIFQVFNLYM